MNPPKVDAGSGAFVLIVRGSGFSSDAVVQWNDAPRTTIFVHEGKLLARILADDVTSAGVAQISAPGQTRTFLMFQGGPSLMCEAGRRPMQWPQDAEPRQSVN